MGQFTCKVCGAVEESSRWINGKTLETNQLCHNCNFWNEIVPSYNEGQHFVAQDNTCYYIGAEDSKETYFRGFGGAHTTITFNNGRIVKSTNLWCRGEVPEHFKRLLPINAHLEWK